MDREIKRASTGFTPAKGSPVAARMIAKLGAAAAADPKQREAVARQVAGQLGRFQAAAAAARGGVVKSDVADIYAVAFILNYEVLNDAGGEAPGTARRRWLAERFRARLMNDEEFQGTEDAGRVPPRARGGAARPARGGAPGCVRRARMRPRGDWSLRRDGVLGRRTHA
jgi:hypothetical protein